VPRVRVGPLPRWMPARRLLGRGDWTIEPDEEVNNAIVAQAELSREAASDVLARLRGLAFGGLDLRVQVRPSLKRSQVRAGRTREARARRDTTPGFTRLGVRLDEEGRWSLTPEALALELGERIGAGTRVLDLTCGAGGNAIGFARAGCEVIAVDQDARLLADARHNARIYGVAERMRFVHGDALEQAARHPADVVFVDPPWGEYDKRRTTLADLPLLQALLPHLPAGPELHLKLPPSFDVSTLPFEARVQPLFGRAPGDRHRVKLLWVRRA